MMQIRTRGKIRTMVLGRDGKGQDGPRWNRRAKILVHTVRKKGDVCKQYPSIGW